MKQRLRFAEDKLRSTENEIEICKGAEKDSEAKDEIDIGEVD